MRLVGDKNFGAARSAAVGKVPADNLASLLVGMGTKSAVEALKLPSLSLEVICGPQSHSIIVLQFSEKTMGVYHQGTKLLLFIIKLKLNFGRLTTLHLIQLHANVTQLT